LQEEYAMPAEGGPLSAVKTAAAFAALEHFQAKWNHLATLKMRPNKTLEHGG
jgi:hypothetical protein